jgi:hypothetical protein
MTKTTLTLAALMMATSALSSAAEAGGVRLQFGGPLGSFVAHPHLSSGPGGTMRNQRYAHQPSYHKPAFAKPSYLGRRPHEDDAPAHKVVRHKAPKVEAAEAPVVRKIRKPAAVQIAKVEDASVISDAAPAIFVPQSPDPATAFTGTQSTPAAVRNTVAANTEPNTVVAGIEPDNKTEVVVLPVVEDETAKSEKPAKTEKAEKTGSVAAKICRRFSAAIASLVTVPCE